LLNYLNELKILFKLGLFLSNKLVQRLNDLEIFAICLVKMFFPIIKTQRIHSSLYAHMNKGIKNMKRVNLGGKGRCSGNLQQQNESTAFLSPHQWLDAMSRGEFYHC